MDIDAEKIELAKLLFETNDQQVLQKNQEPIKKRALRLVE